MSFFSMIDEKTKDVLRILNVLFYKGKLTPTEWAT